MNDFPITRVRRRLLRGFAGAGAIAAGGPAAAQSSSESGSQSRASSDARARFEPVARDRPLRFPRDFGAHPGFRTEWWYVTCWLRAGTLDIGAQITFFRARTAHDERNPSRFAPTQLLLAHAALAVDGESRLRHDQRAARAGFGLARANTADTDLQIGSDWTLRRGPGDRYSARIVGNTFVLELGLSPRAAPVAQGDDGYSRKGPRPEQASHYYSRPQLDVIGTVSLQSLPGAGAQRTLPVDGRAWLDHEWSSELLDPQAQGWDWVGLNFDDGTSLMAFRIRSRDASGSPGALWSHARWIGAGQRTEPVRFEPVRQWRSPRSGAEWPVEMRLVVGERRLDLRPMFDDQELDTRASTGTIYWEGAVRVFERDRLIGRGYLELTGYAGALRL